ncbi:MAG: iron ABC transporter permease [Candidatus Methanomethylophilaceae archaeon]|nr:iron ABC transporter permease [Candidatus Methanomethylophilaceae archaeon]
MFRDSYRRTRARRISFILVCIVACLILSIYSVTIGPYPMTMGDVIDVLWNFITMQPQGDTTIAHIVLNLRLPRIIGGIICGFALAVCGAAMQSMMKNPLADPYTMGISSGAGFGAALAMILGIELIAGGGIVVNAFVFAVIPAVIILFLSRFRKATPTMMVLCGISLMYLFNALTQLFMLIADPDDMSAVYEWMVGSLDGVSYDELLLVLLVTVIGSLYVQYMANQLNVMGIGDESAQTLGVDVERRRLVILMVITLVAASVVSFTGVIGFVGLVAPHIARTLIGSDNRYLVPASGVVGSLLLVASDILARTIASPVMLPVGVITACVGGPLFMLLILRSTKETWS